jgi:hypothetical protein
VLVKPMSTPHSATRPLPDLRVVRTGELLAHERPDRQRAATLAQRLCADGVLKNPPIASPLGHDSPAYVIMDGANRVIALSVIGAPHTLAQVMDYDSGQVELSAWNHLIAGLGWDDLFAALTEIEGLEIALVGQESARIGLERHDFLACLISPQGDCYGLRGGHDLHSRTALINTVVDTYKERGQLHRTTAHQIEEVAQHYDEITGLLIFPRYEPNEILTLVRSGEYLPPGVTRHLITGRALRVNYPLDELMSDRSLAGKNQRLAKWFRRKVNTRQVRYYAESTYLFDE